MRRIMFLSAMERASGYFFCVASICSIMVTFLLMLSFICEWIQIT